MASLNAKVLSRVDTVKIGAVGALEAACTDLGSVFDAELMIEMDENVATDAADLDAVVAVAYSGVKGTVTFTAQDITKANVALALGGEVSTNDVYVTPGNMATPTYYTCYIRGSYMDGTAAVWHIVKCYFKPGTGLKLGKEQQTLTFTGTLMSDPSAVATLGYSMFAVKSAATDTTAPTVTIVPADAATGVLATANIVWTFSEAIRAEDVTPAKFFAFKADGTAVAGALSIDTAHEVVTLNPTASLDASGVYNAVAVGGTGGVRNVAGIPLAATSATQFTVAS